MFWIIEHLFITTTLMVILGLILVLAIFWFSQKIFNHELKPQFVSAIAGLFVTVLFSVILNNLYALKRDTDSRLVVLRDKHYEQLRPVLRNEAAKLREIAVQIARAGYITGATKAWTTSMDPLFMLWPEIMSQDLSRHFPEYDKSKHDLLLQIQFQDQEFRAAVITTEGKIKPTRLLPGWKDNISISFIRQCMGFDEGIKLTVEKDRYIFNSVGNNGNGIGKPPPELIIAFKAFQSIQPDDGLITHCRALKSRANLIQDSAEELAKKALLFSQGSILKGDCEFIKSTSLSD